MKVVLGSKWFWIKIFGMKSDSFILNWMNLYLTLMEPDMGNQRNKFMTTSHSTHGRDAGKD